MKFFKIFEEKIKLKSLRYGIEIYGKTKITYPSDPWERKNCFGNIFNEIFKKYFDKNQIIIKYSGKELGILTYIEIIAFNSNIKYKKSYNKEEIQNMLFKIFNDKIINSFIFYCSDDTHLKSCNIEYNFTDYDYEEYLRYNDKSAFESGKTNITIFEENEAETFYCE